MFNFTAHFFENEIYINNKFAYNNNEFLTELLNLEITEDLNKFRDILTKQFKNLFFYGDMQDYEIENHHKHAQNVQSTMRRLDFLFAKFSISNLISTSEEIQTEKLYELLSSEESLWQVSDDGDHLSDYCDEEFENDYGFNYADIDDCGQKIYKSVRRHYITTNG